MEMFMNLKCFGKEALREIFLWPCTNTPDMGKGHNGSTMHTHASANTHTQTHTTTHTHTHLHTNNM